jgi:hypothetical protein
MSHRPETIISTHYFFQQSHRAGEGDDRIVESIYDSLVGAFDEDRDMITAQARNMALNPQARMMPLAIDSALLQFRRLVEREIAAESVR